MRISLSLIILLLLAFPACGWTQEQGVAHRPNLDLYVEGRAYLPGEEVALRLSAFNEKTVAFSLYRLDLPALIPTSRALENLRKPLMALDARRLRAVRSWSVKLGQTYPDQWSEREVKMPKLASGVYLVRARGAGAEKRTWFAITEIALLAKRSRQEILLYATNGHSGQPMPDIGLTVTDAKGGRTRGVTDRAGILRLKQPDTTGNIWVYGERQGSPVFTLVGAPPPPDPFAIYTVTDRPIYRPSHRVHFKNTFRQRLETDAPGGFVYRPYVQKKVKIEIRDATDALVYRREMTTNAFGSVEGDFTLASEPTLGRWQIVASVGEFSAYGEFQVEAYRKPEFSVGVQFAQTHYLGSSTVPVTIEARYYFGQPAANAAVNYTIQFTPETPNFDYQNGAARGADLAIESPYVGQGVLDAKGQLKLEIKTKRLPFNRRLTITANVTDLSRRTQQGEGGALITAGMFHLTVATDKTLYRPGERVTVQVHASDYDNKPVSTQLRVQLIETKFDSKKRMYEEKTTRDILADAKGDGEATFSPPRPGYLRLLVTAFDSQQNRIQAVGYVWIVGAEFADYNYPTLNLISERASYRPGEVATILLNTSLVTPPGAKRAEAAPRSNRGRRNRRIQDALRRRSGQPVKSPAAPPTYRQAWALVTVEGERLYAHTLVPLVSRSTELRVPLDARYFPAVTVSVSIVQEKEVYEQQIRLEVARPEQKISVSVTPDRARYAPGESATYTVSTRDYLGHPVPAELSFGLVDASIYAIQPDNTPDLFGFFYGGQQVRVQTDFSFAAQYSGGAYQTMPQPKPGAPGAGARTAPTIRVRRLFADTAYWNAFVATDETGEAKLTFALPDNLTTWRATARGITLDTAVGSATNDVVSTMPLLVRLELPRFYVQGDEAVVSAIVHNYTGTTRSVAASIKATGVDLEGAANRTLELAAGGEQRLDWKARIRSDSREAVIQVIADGGEGAQDATELTLPVAPDGVKMVESRADALTEGTFRQDLSSLPPDAALTLTLSPSVAASIFDALNFLTSYPYGCAEQTMSSFLPDVVVSRALRNLGVNRKVNPNLEQWVNLGLQKLYRYQHQDGGWNWWEFDQTDGDMTAYVLYGLTQAKEAGYLVDDLRLNRGAEALLALLKNQQEWNSRAEWLLALAYARPQAVAKPLAEAFENRDKLDPYGQASLCLALAREGGKFTASAAKVAQELAGKAKEEGTFAFWPAEEGGYSWRSDNADVTARVLRALLTATPNSPLIPKAVRWLMGNRSDTAWDSTKTSAEVVLALTQYMAQTRELQPDFHATIRLDGQTLKTIAMNAQNVFAPPATITIPPEQWRGHSALSIDKEGAGVLYVTQTQRYLIPASQAKPLSRGIAVHRTYRIAAEDPSQAGSVPSGEGIEVDVDVTADADYRYALLEEPIPAGCEVAPSNQENESAFARFEDGQGGYTRQEVHDNHLAFFFDFLPKGRAHLVYHLHAETPGLYRILPALASLVYFPEVRGNTGLVKARIEERK